MLYIAAATTNNVNKQSICITCSDSLTLTVDPESPEVPPKSYTEKNNMR